MGTEGAATPIGWFDKAIAQRDTRAPFIMPGLFGRQFVSTPYWPPLRKKMNLPEASP